MNIEQAKNYIKELENFVNKTGSDVLIKIETEMKQFHIQQITHVDESFDVSTDESSDNESSDDETSDDSGESTNNYSDDDFVDESSNNDFVDEFIDTSKIRKISNNHVVDTREIIGNVLNIEPDGTTYYDGIRVNVLDKYMKFTYGLKKDKTIFAINRPIYFNLIISDKKLIGQNVVARIICPDMVDWRKNFFFNDEKDIMEFILERENSIEILVSRSSQLHKSRCLIPYILEIKIGNNIFLRAKMIEVGKNYNTRGNKY